MGLSVLVFIIGLYTAIVAYMAIFQRSMVFHPTMVDVFTAELLETYTPFETVHIVTADGLTLKGLYVAAQNDKPTIVYFHGNAGTVADRLAKTKLPLLEGYGFLMTEYRGFGGNPGLPTEQGLYHDARAWLDFLQQQGLTPGQLIYHGESLGTGVAVQMASEQKPAILILEAPFTSITDVAAFYYPYLPVKLLLQHRFESVHKVKTLDMPVMIYHGTKDRTVPYRFGQQLFAALPGKDKIFVSITDGQHHDLYDQGAGTQVMEFIQKHAP